MESAITHIGHERRTAPSQAHEGRFSGGWNLHYALGVGFLGVVALITVGGSIFLASSGSGIPDLLSTASGGAIGALAGLLVNPKDN